MKHLLVLALLGLSALPAPGRAGEAGDLVFAERAPWSLPQPLVWSLRQSGPEVEGFKPLGEGRVTLSAITDPTDGKPVLQLAEDTPRIKRKIGPFPTEGGDPALTFFLETVSRDMAALTGGSPFYIRNRLKDALFRGGEVRAENGGKLAVFTPFKGDKNAERMYGFDTLELRFALSDARQPIRAMVAETGPLAGGRPAYHSEMVLK
ncbi:hypothetical protein GL279_00960 [Paracoccus limosus]|uniref:Uncharacterized protein n=1 Tax=Paracoccus limosus TaxID=913252 RepID=A0A844GWU4_9RHOB|nr:hypothetical protein [Paracoccus limosus]MTH33166.1 hypothetical protein [Paracoccus limosus]